MRRWRGEHIRELFIAFERQAKARVVQVEAVHDLVVVVAWGLKGVSGEGVAVGSFEEDDPSGVLVEEGVLLGVVEGVFVVGDDFSGEGPGSCGGIGLGEPDLAEDG